LPRRTRENAPVADGFQKRVALNEGTMREVNEGIERGRWPGERESPIAFRCECAELGCNELINVPLAEYERVRSNPRWFLVAPGHAGPEGEVVVETATGYEIVEKREAAAAIAEAIDPRD
jgi:hypothetical protein